MANKPLPSRCYGVGVYESADCGVIVSALEVVQAGFGVVDIAAVAQGVMGAEGGGQVAGGGKGSAPCVVGVADFQPRPVAVCCLRFAGLGQGDNRTVPLSLAFQSPILGSVTSSNNGGGTSTPKKLEMIL